MTTLRSTTLHRHSFGASRTLTSSVAQRNPNTGQPQPYTITRRINALLMAVLYTASPAVTICIHPRGAAARLTNLNHARIALIAATITAGAAASLMWRFYDHALLVLAAVLVAVFSGTLIALNLDALWAASHIPAKGTHLVSDLTRYPDAPTGIGGELIDDLNHHPATIIGTATNNEAWTKVYAKRTNPVGTATNGRTHFHLQRKST